MNIPKKIIIHHSVGTDHPVLENWEAIRRYHTNDRGWRDIGYHYGLERVDNRVRVQRGRNPWECGAHAPASGPEWPSNNCQSLGVCVVGDFQREPPDTETLLVLTELCWSLCVAFNINPVRIYGHREVMRPGYTVCPGQAFPLNKLRTWVLSAWNTKIGLGG